jgi:hypothetical protein
MLSEIFWTFLITSTIGFCLGLVGLLYKSKCQEVSCCGLKVIRNVELEEKIDEMNIERHVDTKSNE